MHSTQIPFRGAEARLRTRLQRKKLAYTSEEIRCFHLDLQKVLRMTLDDLGESWGGPPMRLYSSLRIAYSRTSSEEESFRWWLKKGEPACSSCSWTKLHQAIGHHEADLPWPWGGKYFVCMPESMGRTSVTRS